MDGLKDCVPFRAEQSPQLDLFADIPTKKKNPLKACPKSICPMPCLISENALKKNEAIVAEAQAMIEAAIAKL